MQDTGLLWAFFFTSSITCDVFSSPTRSVSLFFTSAICEPFFTNAFCGPFFQQQRNLWWFFFTNAICEPFFQQQRDLWCHCFAVTNSGLTSPDPLLTSTDKWRFCLTGIKRISKQARHSSGMAGECRNWLRLRFGLQCTVVRFPINQGSKVMSGLGNPTTCSWTTLSRNSCGSGGHWAWQEE